MKALTDNLMYSTSLADTTMTVDMLAEKVNDNATAFMQIRSSYRPALHGRPAGNYVLHYRLGPTSVKYTAVPDVIETGPPPSPSKDYLREAMAATLKGGEAGFTFAVQLFKDDRTTPVEDATVDWGKAGAELVPVARVVIPPQDFDTEAREAFCQHLSFTPWHALAEHCPLGGINRIRRSAYAASSAVRHQLNGVAEKEPTSGTV